MKFTRLAGWKLWTWAIVSLLWSGFYFFSRLATDKSAGGVNDGLTFLFNWLFPIALAYLLLTVGERRKRG